MENTKPKSLYAAFDTYPAPKGAAIHIQHMAKVLYEFKSPGALYVLGGDQLPRYQQEGSIEIFRYSGKIANLLERTLDFGAELTRWLELRGSKLEICHFRDPWTAYPIIDYKHRKSLNFATVFEVNGLPSIELPYAYPHVASSTLDKIRKQENFCLQHADHLITPSQTTRNYLVQRGIAESKITVIRNGAEPVREACSPLEAPRRYLLYFGALQQWQGIEDLFRAFSMLKDVANIELVMCVSKHNRIAKQYRKMAEKLEIQTRIHWLYGLPTLDLQRWIFNAHLSIAPLTECSRNSEQGCCPLKIIESMAAGTPVVASKLPVVEELISDNINGRLYRPGRPADLARIIRVLLDCPDEADRLGTNARNHIAEHWTWEQADDRLRDVYQQLENISV